VNKCEKKYVNYDFLLLCWINIRRNDAKKDGNGYSADCITDGCSMASAPAYKKGSSTSIGTPYMLTIDLEKATPLKEILLSTNMVNGSDSFRYDNAIPIRSHSCLWYDQFEYRKLSQ